MFLTHKIGHAESFDYSQLPGYETLSPNKQNLVHEAFAIAYRGSLPLGIKIAMGKAHENAKLALIEALKPEPKQAQPAPRSIFAGLDNC